MTAAERNDSASTGFDAGSPRPHGLHHVTAIASDPQGNVDFYTRTLGLRLVKQTVNFDVPEVYHLYYGDEQGSPSSLITFFPWPGVTRGRQGAGLSTATAFGIPAESMGWWSERFTRLGVDFDPPTTRDDEDVLTFRDPDGMIIDLVAADGGGRSGWDGVGDIPAEHAVRGLHAVTLSEHELDPSASMLTDLLGMQLTAEAGARARFGMSAGGRAGTTPAAGGSGALVNLFGGVREKGLQAGGTVHHVAFRAPDLDTMAGWRAVLVDHGVEVTEILDRQYFKSIYFREPGGVLFEIATDAPGFAVDEPLLELGRSLKLPPWLEPNREQIAASLPPLRLDVDVP